MQDPFSITIDAWPHQGPIPARFAFGKPGEDGPFAVSDNLSPAISWSNTPEGAQSFALICHDPDVPSSAEDVNQEGCLVPADLPRVDFYHWLLIDIPASAHELPEGSGGEGVVARGKPVGTTEYGVCGKNNYTDWFAGDPDMEGVYGNYDGPCPPWNDSIVHHYHFTLYALDLPSLDLKGEFTGPEALAAMEGHILASATHIGTYSMNPEVPA
ncbi:MAG: YbhB/YbcL family Raf kinase inhibitor-like protein [Verrucomicrobiota bacterium]